MSNTNLTIDMITKEALEIAHEQCTFLGTVNTSYDNSFGKSGGKIGDTLRIRNPIKFVPREGSRVMDVQDVTETSQSVVVATQDGIDLRFNSAELALDIDEFNARYLNPAISGLVSLIESKALARFTKDVYQVVGTAGTVVGASSDISALGAARAKINQQLAPKNNRNIQLDSVTMGSIVNGTKSLFHDGMQIKQGFREGFIGRSAMADFYENERTWTMTNSADVSGVTLNTYTIVDNDSDISVTGLSNAPTEGMVFTIAGVYDCHPETKQAYSHLKQFVVTTGSTTSTINFSPAIRTTGAYKNVAASNGDDISITSSTAALVFVGSASTSYQQNIMYHKDAFTFVTADLPLMDDAHKCYRSNKDGLSLRAWQASDIKNDELLIRFDILYGYKTLRPEWAARLTN